MVKNEVDFVVKNEVDFAVDFLGVCLCRGNPQQKFTAFFTAVFTCVFSV